MGKENTQQKLSRIRPPRVQITYDVEVGDAIESKELPFVMGVMGDYSGQPKEALPKLKERKFVQIDKETFDDVLEGMAPRLQIRVENKLTGNNSEMPIELNFRQLEDFSPDGIIRQVDPLQKLLDLRSRLSDLRNKLAGNEKIEELLDEVVRDTEKLKQIASEPSTQDKGE